MASNRVKGPHIKTLLKGVKLEFRIPGFDEWRLRVRIATWLVRIAAWVMWTSVEVMDADCGEDACCDGEDCDGEDGCCG